MIFYLKTFRWFSISGAMEEGCFVREERVADFKAMEEGSFGRLCEGGKGSRFQGYGGGEFWEVV